MISAYKMKYQKRDLYLNFWGCPPCARPARHDPVGGGGLLGRLPQECDHPVQQIQGKNGQCAPAESLERTEGWVFGGNIAPLVHQVNSLAPRKKW